MYSARVKTENVVKGNIVNGKRVHSVLPVGPEGVISCVVRTRKGWGILDLTPGSLVTVKRYNRQKKAKAEVSDVLSGDFPESTISEVDILGF